MRIYLALYNLSSENHEIQNQILNDIDFQNIYKERIKVCEPLNVCLNKSRWKLLVDSNI